MWAELAKSNPTVLFEFGEACTAWKVSKYGPKIPPHSTPFTQWWVIKSVGVVAWMFHFWIFKKIFGWIDCLV